MQLKDVFEGARDDANASHLVDDLRQKMYSYLYKNKKDKSFEVRTAVFKGEDQDCLLVRDVDPDSVFNKVLVIFQYGDGYGQGGSMHPKRIPAYDVDYIVVLDALDKGIEGMMKTLWVDRTAAAFRHEFIHILDFMRRKEPTERVRSTSPKDDSEAETSRYFNEPLELNAFYHNVAEPILNRIRYANKDGVDTLGLFSPLPNSFQEWLSQRVKSLTGSHRRFWSSLTPENKKSITARLYRLFVEYQGLKDRAQFS